MGISIEEETGQFYCPECIYYRRYKKIRARKKGLFQSKVKQLEMIECQGCFAIFDVDIFEITPPQQIKERLDHNALLALWEYIYTSIKCEEIANSEKWPNEVIDCACFFKEAGTQLFVRDYENAKWLLEILIRTGTNYKLHSMGYDFPEKYTNTLTGLMTAARIILTNM